MSEKLNITIINGAFEETNNMKELFEIINSNLDNCITLELKLNIINISNLISCRGCKRCFKKGVCALDSMDNFYEYKERLIKSNIIMIYTPVYVDNVSGIIKTFIDRLASWSHKMTLAGKLCIIIITSNNTGIEWVGNYLYKVMSSYGLIVIGLITKTSKSNLKELKQQINDVIFRLLYYRKFPQKISTNYCLENLYSSYSYIYQNLCDSDNFEKKVWEKKFGKHRSLCDYIDQK